MSRERESYIADKRSDCIHFTGTLEKTCAAGVAYENVRLVHEPKPTVGGSRLRVSLPCVGALNPTGATCNKRECWSAEAAAKRYDDDLDSTGMVLGAAALIAAKFEEDGQEHGTIECPKCRGVLRFNCAKRGRGLFMMARCQTPNCVGFMT